MKIITDPKRPDDVEDVFIPPHLRKHIIPWMHASYKKFDAGHLLMQQSSAVGFSIYFYYIIMECPATIYLQCDYPTITLCQQLHSICLEYFPRGNVGLDLPKGVVELMYFELGADWIRDIAYNNAAVWKIFQAASTRENKSLRAAEVPISYMIKQIISEIKTCKEIGMGLDIELKVQILEFLNAYRKGLPENKVVDVLSTPYKEMLLNISDDIRSNPNIHRHNLSSLSKKNYIHQKTLSRNFKKLFCVDLHTYVLRECMKKGHHLIITTARKVDDIARELGYKEPNSFNRAFKKHFSFPPKTLRLQTR